MKARFKDLATQDGLDKVFDESAERPALLFKHSDTCPISHDVFRSVSTVDSDIYLVVVQRSRDISNTLADRTGVPHQSPQALILKDGICVFHASHYDINPETLSKYI